MPPKIEQTRGSQVQTQIASAPTARHISTSAPVDLSGFAQGFKQLKEQTDRTEAEEALTNFEREKNKIFFDPEVGYFNKQGRDAFDGAEATNEQLEKLRRDFEKNIKSDFAKQEFNRVANEHITRAGRDIMGHASKNMRAWKISTVNAQIENTVENAAFSWNDSEKLGTQRALGRQAVVDSAKLEGLSAEATNERLQNYETAFASTAISSAIDVGVVEGTEMLDKMRDRLEPNDLKKMENLLAKKQTAEDTKRQAQSAILQAGNMVEAFGDLDNARSAILDEVNKINDPDERKATMKEAMAQLNMKQRADVEERGAIFEQGEEFIINGGTVEQFRADQPELWEKMSAKQKRALSAGKDIETDYVALSDLLTMPKTKLAQINPADHFHKLGKSDRAKLIGAVKSARSGGGEHQVGRTRSAESVSAIEQLLGKKKDWGKDDTIRANQLHAFISDEVNVREDSKGAPLSANEFTDMLNDVMGKVTRKRELFFGLTFGNTTDDITEIPTDILPGIVERIQSKGYPATTKNILQAYADYQRQVN